MNLWIAAVGRQKAGPAKDLYEEYARRLRWPLALREVEERRPLPVEQLKKREAKLLLKAVPEKSVVVALDEGGRSLSSQAFAGRLRGWQDEGRQDVAFLIGGADGLDADVKSRADLRLSLSAMTWPHMVVRVLLAEQIFRAQSILTGHPYHREG